MRTSTTPGSFYFRIGISIISVLLLLSITVLSPPDNLYIAFVIVGLTAFLYNFPIRLFRNDSNAIHIVTLTGALTVGAVTTGWAVLIGIILGVYIYRLRMPASYRRLTPTVPYRFESGLSIGMQLMPLVPAFFLTGWLEGTQASAWDIFPHALMPMLIFLTLHGAIYIVDIWLRKQPGSLLEKEDLLDFGALALLPLPFIMMAISFMPGEAVSSLIFIGSITCVLAVLIFQFNKTRLDLERRLQDISILNKISVVMRSTLDQENLLSVIQVQVTQLLNIDNFYVALYDQNEQHIWYPLAVKRGQRQRWSPRPLMQDRLTDRVIQEGKHILLNPSEGDDPALVGIPASVEAPCAWIGVPLITANSTIGCLAVFSVDPVPELNQGDLNLLNILSGQISVAIENALLYEQAQRRTSQLETLNRISALITASLDQKEVLMQVCRSVAEVGGAQHSAIFLLNPEQGQVSLAHAFGLSKSFQASNEHFSVNQNGRMECLRSGRPVLTPLLTESTFNEEHLDSLKEDGIQAFGEFPLTTPDGQIGFLAVYYDELHTFTSEEVKLLQTFAAQAALAVANARLYAHVDTALSRRAHQLSILEAVGRELAAAIRSERLFEMIVDYAMQFTVSRWGELSLYDSRRNSLEVKASRGYKINRSRFSVQDDIAGSVVDTPKPIILNDFLDEPSYIDLTGGAARSLLAIPLIHEGRVLGVLKLESQRPYAYDENDQSFISQLATQAAVAVVNAELYRETQRHLREQLILFQVSTQLMGNPGLESVLQTLGHSIEAAIHSPSVGAYLWDEKQSSYILHFSTVSVEKPECSLPEIISHSVLGSRNSSPIKTGPLSLAPQSREQLLGGCQNCQSLIFPLVVNQKRFGMVLLHINKDLQVSDEQLQLIRSIVAHVSISLQNVLLILDITHHRDRMAALLNSVEEGILMMDSDGNILLANQMIRTITGLNIEDLLNCPFAELPAAALNAFGYTRQEAEKLVQDLGQNTGAVKNTWDTSENLPKRVLERFTSPVWAQGGKIIGWMLVLRDVSKEHQLTDARELITGTLIHDLRSPVSAVISAVDILDEVLAEKHQDEIVDQALKVAHNGAMRVLGLIESLLDIARMQSGTMELKLFNVNLHHLAANSLNEFLPQANEYGIFLLNNVPTDLAPFKADQNKLLRVLTNLFDNALKFTPTGGQVQVSAAYNPNGTIAIRVSDNGPGIPDEYREKIFERFTQIPGQQGRRRGSGLGLTFCRMAIEAHGGRIWVESRQPPDTGSIFTILLPGNTGTEEPRGSQPGFESGISDKLAPDPNSAPEV